jgi:hypothetical protein
LSNPRTFFSALVLPLALGVVGVGVVISISGASVLGIGGGRGVVFNGAGCGGCCGCGAFPF